MLKYFVIGTGSISGPGLIGARVLRAARVAASFFSAARRAAAVAVAPLRRRRRRVTPPPSLASAPSPFLCHRRRQRSSQPSTSSAVSSAAVPVLFFSSVVVLPVASRGFSSVGVAMADAVLPKVADVLDTGSNIKGENVPVHVTSIRLNKDNYLSWSAALEIGITSRGRLQYITGEKPAPAKNDPQ
ncbi:hypothetical protein EJ110_NYTH52946 [Nymphaea thermarum]|nr:hypothetical protein EJ110_NYTH52946 [Nymphaea thermarum]